MSGAWSRDSRRLLVSDQWDTDRRRFRLRAISARTGRIVTSRKLLGEPVAGGEAVSPTGDRIAIGVRRPGSFDLRAVVLTLRTGRRVELGRTTYAPPAFSPDGRSVAVGIADGFVDVLDAASGALQQRVATPGVVPSELSWSPDSSRVAYIALRPELFSCPTRCGRGATDTGLAVAHLQDGHVDTLLTAEGRTVTQLAWRPDGQALIAACRTAVAAGC
jgi:Tol biopolymer transport system component